MVLIHKVGCFGIDKLRAGSHILHLSVIENQFTSLPNVTASFFLFLHSDVFWIPMHIAKTCPSQLLVIDLLGLFNWPGSNSPNSKFPGEKVGLAQPLLCIGTSKVICFLVSSHLPSKAVEWGSMNLAVGAFSWR